MSTARLLTKMDSLPEVLNYYIASYLTTLDLRCALSVSQGWLKHILKYDNLVLKRTYREQSEISKMFRNTFYNLLNKPAETEHEEKIIVEKVKFLISLGINVDFWLLSSAAKHVEVLRVLSNKIFSNSMLINSLAMYAVENDFLAVIEFLHEMNYDFEKEWFPGWSLVKLAAREHSVETILTFGNLGISLDNKNTPFTYSLIYIALADLGDRDTPYDKRLATLQALLKAGITIYHQKKLLAWLEATFRASTGYLTFREQEMGDPILFKNSAMEMIKKHCIEQERHTKVFQSFFKSKQIKETPKKSIELTTFAMLNK